MSTFTYTAKVVNFRKKYIEELARPYQSFESVDAMDRHIEAHLTNIGLFINENTLHLLEFIARHSLKVVGVSWLSVRSMAKLLSVSDRTVQRALAKLEQLGVINRIATVDPDGGQGANLVVIKPAEIDEVPEAVTGVVTPPVVHNLSNLTNLKESKNEVKAYTHPREVEFVKIAVERGLPKSTAEFILPSVSELLHTAGLLTVRLTLDNLVDRLTKAPRSIVHIGAWYAKTLKCAVELNKAETTAILARASLRTRHQTA